MSRIGKKAIALPKGVTASVDGQTVKVKGPKGELSVKLVPEVSASVDDHGVHVMPRKEMEKAPQMWGLSRTLVNNLVAGVTTGFTQKLEIRRRLSRGGAGQGVEPAARLQPRRALCDPGRHHHRHRKAHHDFCVGHRQAARRPGCRRDSFLASAGAL